MQRDVYSPQPVSRSCNHVPHRLEHPTVDCSGAPRKNYLRYGVANPVLCRPECLNSCSSQREGGLETPTTDLILPTVNSSGLTHECYEKPFSPGGGIVCDPYSNAPGEWSATFAFLIIGVYNVGPIRAAQLHAADPTFVRQAHWP